MNLYKKALGLSIVLLFMSITLNAQIQTDRPGQSDNSLTVGSGNFQMEGGFIAQSDGENDLSVRSLTIPIALFRYGISDMIEIRLLSSFNSKEFMGATTNGMTDLEIGAKIQVLNNDDVNTKISFITHLITPTGSTNLSSDSFGTINKFSISHSLSDKMGLTYNIGHAYYGSGSGNLNYTLNLVTSINDSFSFFVEAYGSYVEFEDFQQSIDGGISYLINNNLQLDFAIATGINYKMRHFATGISWLID